MGSIKSEKPFWVVIMEIVEIPLSSSAPHFMQENEIFGQTFFLEFEWIETEGFWLLHVADEKERPLSSGIKLQPEWPLYTHHQTKVPFTFMIISRLPGQCLERATLRDEFTLVAYEIV
jgi:hypothetical protein